MPHILLQYIVLLSFWYCFGASHGAVVCCLRMDWIGLDWMGVLVRRWWCTGIHSHQGITNGTETDSQPSTRWQSFSKQPISQQGSKHNTSSSNCCYTLGCRMSHAADIKWQNFCHANSKSSSRGLCNSYLTHYGKLGTSSTGTAGDLWHHQLVSSQCCSYPLE